MCPAGSTGPRDSRPHSWGCPPSCVASNFQLQLASPLPLRPRWEPGKTTGRSCLTGVTHQGCLALPGVAFLGPLTTPAPGSTSSLQPSASQGPPTPRGRLHSWLAASLTKARAVQDGLNPESAEQNLAWSIGGGRDKGRVQQSTRAGLQVARADARRGELPAGRQQTRPRAPLTPAHSRPHWVPLPRRGLQPGWAPSTGLAML